MELELLYREESHREDLSRPFNLYGYTLACNGWVGLMVPERDGIEPYHGEHEGFYSIMIQCAEQANFKPVKQPLTFAMQDCVQCHGTGLTQKTMCEECDGDGTLYFINKFHEYTAECKSCEGFGHTLRIGTGETCELCDGKKQFVDSKSIVLVDGVPVSAQKLAIIANERDLELASDSKSNMIYFRYVHDDGDHIGFIMADVSVSQDKLDAAKPLELPQQA